MLFSSDLMCECVCELGADIIGLASSCSINANPESAIISNKNQLIRYGEGRGGEGRGTPDSDWFIWISLTGLAVHSSTR